MYQHRKSAIYNIRWCKNELKEIYSKIGKQNKIADKNINCLIGKIVGGLIKYYAKIIF